MDRVRVARAAAGLRNASCSLKVKRRQTNPFSPDFVDIFMTESASPLTSRGRGKKAAICWLSINVAFLVKQSGWVDLPVQHKVWLTFQCLIYVVLNVFMHWASDKGGFFIEAIKCACARSAFVSCASLRTTVQDCWLMWNLHISCSYICCFTSLCLEAGQGERDLGGFFWFLMWSC